tara:strand:- start:474 stop:638 length:165 start_codon:yes stop_codon:yes gene_type:complete
LPGVYPLLGIFEVISDVDTVVPATLRQDVQSELSIDDPVFPPGYPVNLPIVDCG